MRIGGRVRAARVLIVGHSVNPHVAAAGIHMVCLMVWMVNRQEQLHYAVTSMNASPWYRVRRRACTRRVSLTVSVNPCKAFADRHFFYAITDVVNRQIQRHHAIATRSIRRSICRCIVASIVRTAITICPNETTTCRMDIRIGGFMINCQI